MAERKGGESKRYLWSSANNQVSYTEISSNGNVRKIFEAKKGLPGISESAAYALDLQVSQEIYSANTDSKKSKQDLRKEIQKLAAQRAFEKYGDRAVDVTYEKIPSPAFSVRDLN